MARKPEKRGLGRGLSALMADIDGPGQEDGQEPRRDVQTVEITRVFPNPDQPRRMFNEEDLNDLVRSISEKGIIQPLIVRPDPADQAQFQIVAGERRWRAAQRAKIDRVPIIIRDLDDLEVLEIAIIENIQRSDLNPIDEARGYQMLMEKFGHTQEKLSEALGKSRSYLANSMRLLSLPEPVLDFLADGSLSVGHARAMITAEDPVALARTAVSKGLSVRQVEALAKKPKADPAKARRKAVDKDSDTISLEADLTANLGMKVSINHPAGGEGGSLSIRYASLDDLDVLCQILSATRSAGST